jgi:hypothetical protein
MATFRVILLYGRLIKSQADDPRGTRHTAHGAGADGTTPVWIVGRSADTLKQVQASAAGTIPADRSEQVPVAQAR